MTFFGLVHCSLGDLLIFNKGYVEWMSNFFWVKKLQLDFSYSVGEYIRLEWKAFQHFPSVTRGLHVTNALEGNAGGTRVSEITRLWIQKGMKKNHRYLIYKLFVWLCKNWLKICAINNSQWILLVGEMWKANNFNMTQRDKSETVKWILQLAK